MLRMDDRNINFNGASIIDDEQIASMSAGVINDTRVYFNFNIDNITTYLANDEAVDEDFKSFKEAVLNVI